MERINDKTHPATNKTIPTMSFVSASRPDESRREGIKKENTNTIVSAAAALSTLMLICL